MNPRGVRAICRIVERSVHPVRGVSAVQNDRQEVGRHIQQQGSKSRCADVMDRGGWMGDG